MSIEHDLTAIKTADTSGTSTFLQILAAEVGRMQAAHPERAGELARAHALILHGQVLPSADDPTTGQVLSSDAQTLYTVNGTCSCPAGQHGKDCKHLQAWKLYQHIAKRVRQMLAAAPVPCAVPAPAAPPGPAAPFPEAPASVNVRVCVGGREVQWTLRDTDETRLAARLDALLARYPVAGTRAEADPVPPPRCPTHGAMKPSTKGTGFYCPARMADDTYCPERA